MSIEYSEFPIPSKDESGLNPDDYAWATSPLQELKKLREQARQNNWDVTPLVLGCVLDTILGDDGNIFLPFQLGQESGEPFAPQLSLLARDRLSIRLAIEIAAKEIPEDIRNQLRTLHDQVSKLDWSQYADYKKAETAWQTTRDWVLEQTKTDPKLKKARQYYTEVIFSLPKEPHQSTI